MVRGSIRSSGNGRGVTAKAESEVKPALALGLEAVAALLLSLVIGAVLTLFLLPLWSWIEATTGIESIGHSGPASWCFALTGALLFVAWLSVRLWRRRGERR